jgi:hypothetical protein
MALGVVMVGSLFGAVPALAAAPEAPVVTVQEPVHDTTATFLGVINPNEAQEPNNKGGSYKFFYREGTACKGAGGHETKPSGLAFGNVHEELPGETVTGLTPDREYTVCLQFTNLEGETALSTSFSFKTAVAPEKPVTGSATPLTPTSEKLKGTLDPHSTMKVGGYFAYSNPGGSSCLEGPTAGLEEFEGEKEEEAIAVHTTVGGLEPNKTYRACLVASDELGDTTPGPEVSFTTAAAAPEISSESAAGVKSTGATLEAPINPNNQKTKYVFEYSTKASGEPLVLEAPIVKVNGASELEGYPEQGASVALSGLKAGETYYYRVVAENKKSEEDTKPVVFPVQSFTTVPAPHTEPVTAITATTATFKGTLTPLNPTMATEYFFYYNLSSEPSSACTNELETSPVSASTGSTAKAVSTEVTKLQPNHEYAVCLLSRNPFGSEEDPAALPVHFTTLAVPPKIESEGVANVTPVEATLEAQVNPNNQKTTYVFEYATNPALAGATTLTGAALEGFGSQTASVLLAGLKVGETYYYRVVVENTADHEVIDGQVKSLTPQGVPVLSAVQAQGVTSSAATLTGTINPAGATTGYHFAYITRAGYEAGLAANPANPFALAKVATEEVTVPAGYEAVPVKLGIGELTPAETYVFVLVAENVTGTTTSPPAQFTTQGTTPAPPPSEGEGVNPSPGPSPFPAVTVPAVVPFQTIAQLQAKEPKTTATPTTPLTNAEKLAKALKACHKKKGAKRTKCEKQARAKYGKKPKKK